MKLNSNPTFFLFCAAWWAAFLNAQAQIVSWPIANGGNGHFYEAVVAPGGISWSNASSVATNRDGYLATITSSSENAFVFSLVSTGASCWYQEPLSGNWFGPWLGGSQPTGSSEPLGGWTWVTGEPFSYGLSTQQQCRQRKPPPNGRWAHRTCRHVE